MASPVAAACTHKLKFLPGIITTTRPCRGHVAAMADRRLFILQGFALPPTPPTPQQLCLHLGEPQVGPLCHPTLLGSCLGHSEVPSFSLSRPKVKLPHWVH